MAAGALAYWKLGAHSAYGKAALLFACLALGGLLALFGQTYQTGADTWELFASWAALMAPWVLLAALAALWMLWLAVINAAIVLYSGTFFGGEAQLWGLLLANGLALAAWELGAQRFAWLRERWAPRLLALAAGGAATGLALQAIFDWGEAGARQGLAYAVFLALVLTCYRARAKDLFMLAAACLSLMVVTAALLADVLDYGRHGAFVWLLIAVVVLAMGAASAWWLRRMAGAGEA